MAASCRDFFFLFRLFFYLRRRYLLYGEHGKGWVCRHCILELEICARVNIELLIVKLW